jgi:hypothetical protein
MSNYLKPRSPELPPWGFVCVCVCGMFTNLSMIRIFSIFLSWKMALGMVRLTGERGLSSLRDQPADSHGRQLTGTFVLTLMYSHARYIPHSNPQLHLQVKVHFYINSGYSTPWNNFLGVKDIIHKDMEHLWVFVFLCVVCRCECFGFSGRLTRGCRNTKMQNEFWYMPSIVQYYGLKTDRDIHSTPQWRPAEAEVPSPHADIT